MKNSKYQPYKELILGDTISPKEIAKIIGNGCTAAHIRAARQRFLHPNQCKKNTDNWRRNNPEKITESRKKYRNPSREFAANSGMPYDLQEDEAILVGEETAKELAYKFDRSVDAIYRRRVRLLTNT